MTKSLINMRLRNLIELRCVIWAGRYICISIPYINSLCKSQNSISFVRPPAGYLSHDYFLNTPLNGLSPVCCWARDTYQKAKWQTTEVSALGGGSDNAYQCWRAIGRTIWARDVYVRPQGVKPHGRVAYTPITDPEGEHRCYDDDGW